MLTFTVEGRVAHRFHGSYSAVVILDAGTAERRPHLLAWLQNNCPPIKLPWKDNSAFPGAVSTVVTSEELTALDEWLAPLRAEPLCNMFDCFSRSRKVRHSIGGCEHSIDYGPPFTIEVPYQDLLTPLLPGF